MRDHRSIRRTRAFHATGWGLLLLLLAGMLVQHPTAAQELAFAHQAQDNLEWHSALSWYEQAANLAPTSVEPLLGIAQIRLWQAQRDRAATASAAAIRRAPHDPRVWLLAGEIARAQDLPTVAASDWQIAITSDQRQPAAQAAAYDMMELELQAGQPALAIAMTASIAAPPAKMLTDRAIAYFNLGEGSLAIAALAHQTTQDARTSAYAALANMPLGTASLAALGYADLTQGFPRLALAPLHAAVAHDPAYGVGYAYLGWAYWQLGDRALARRTLAQAQHTAPDDAVTIGLQAVLLATDLHPQAALSLIRQWQGRHTPSATLWGISASIAAQAQDSTAEGDSRWQYALTATGNERITALCELAAYFLRTRQGRDDGRATWAITTALTSAPRDSRVLDLAGQWANSTGADSAALAYFQRAITADPHDAAAHADFGIFEYHLNNRTAARLELDKALALDEQGAVRDQIAPILAELGAGADG